jgi:hypothetical protein
VRPRPSSTPDGDSHDRIDSNGRPSLRHNSRLHHIDMGRRYAGTPVLVLVHDRHIRVLGTSGHLLRSEGDLLHTHTPAAVTRAGISGAESRDLVETPFRAIDFGDEDKVGQA